MNGFKVFSFDVYDTCISRTYEKPVDLFFHLGMDICPDHTPHELRKSFATQFAKARVSAEKAACQAHGRKRSCRLHEIYSMLNFPLECPYSIFEVMDLELRLEEKCTYGIESTKNTIRKLRDDNKRIIFISDMYLDKSFIQSQLINHGFFEDGDGLYVSSESTLTKRSGQLFNLALSAENIKSYELCHSGDNLKSDIKSAEQLGIRTVHIRDTRIVNHEVIFSGSKFTPLENRVNSVSRYIRLVNPNTYSSTEQELFSTIAPGIICFSLWALKTAEKKGIKKLYFLARDGDLPYKVAKIFEKQFPSIEISFLYGSRLAWLLPSISFDDKKWEEIVAPSKAKYSFRDLLERLSYTPEEMLQLVVTLKELEIFLDEVKSHTDILAAFKKAMNHREFNQVLCLKINNARNLLMQYFQQEGLFDGHPWAIVDSGWALNSQATLNKLLRSIQFTNDVTGLYFGLIKNHIPTGETGPIYSFTTEGSIFSRRRHISESCFLFSELQSTNGYLLQGGKVIPKFSSLTQDNFSVDYANKLHRFTIEYAKLVVHLNVSPNTFLNNRSIFTKCLGSILKNPTQAIANHLSNIKINADIRHTDTHQYPLCRRLKPTDVLNFTLSIFISKKPSIMWLEGSIALSNLFIATAARTLVMLDNLRQLTIIMKDTITRKIRKSK
jgi:predicted HAD superfamily hydrolase